MRILYQPYVGTQYPETVPILNFTFADLTVSIDTSF